MKQLRRLSGRRSARRAEERFLIDGPVLLNEAIRAGTPIDVVYAEPGADPSTISEVGTAGVPVVEVEAGVLRKVLGVVTPQSVVAVAQQSSVDLSEMLDAAVVDERAVLALVGIQDPGNAGTLVRVAEASGCAGVVLTVGSVDLWNPKTVRASAGSVLRVGASCDVTTQELISMTAERGIGIVATVAHGGGEPGSTDLTGARVILVGSEAHGLPPELRVEAGVTVTIPMEGSVESLNAGVSGALIAFEAARQRRAR